MYLIEECSVSQKQQAFFGIKFEVWKHGPIPKEVFIDLSNDQPEMFARFIELRSENSITNIYPIVDYDPELFNESDIDVLEYVMSRYSAKSATELAQEIGKKDSAWSRIVDSCNLRDYFSNNRSSSSNYNIDFRQYAKSINLAIS